MFEEKHFIDASDDKLKECKDLQRVKNVQTGILYVKRTLNFLEEENAEKKLIELQNQSLMNHEKVIKVFQVQFDIQETASEAFFITSEKKGTVLSNQIKVYMENVSESLENMVKSKKQAAEKFHIYELRLLLNDALEGINYLEAHDFPQRDIAPHNIFFSRDYGSKAFKIGDVTEIHHLLARDIKEFTNLCEETMNYIDPETKSILLFYPSKEGKEVDQSFLSRTPQYNKSIYSLALLLIELITGADIKGLNNKDYTERKPCLFLAMQEVLKNQGFFFWDLIKFMMKPSKKTGIYKAKDLLISKKFKRAMTSSSVDLVELKHVFPQQKNNLFQISLFQIQLDSKAFQVLKLIDYIDLREFSLRFCDILSENGVQELKIILSLPKKLKVFRFSGNKKGKEIFSSEALSDLLAPVEWLNHLKILELVNQNIDFLILSFLIKKISSSKLKQLSLASNPDLGDEIIHILTKAPLFQGLISLNVGGPLQGCGLSATSLGTILNSKQNLQELDFSWNALEEDSNLLKKIKITLAVLDLSYCGLKDGVIKDCFALEKKSSKIINRRNTIVDNIFEEVKAKYDI